MYYKSGKDVKKQGKRTAEDIKKHEDEARADMRKKLGLPDEVISNLANAAKKKPRPVTDPSKPRKRQGF